ncbi:MAG: hypothetical protein LAT65_15275 [Saccharospirillum sp.]|nr:hypothetical protein [Saccharospirillum sp.]
MKALTRFATISLTSLVLAACVGSGVSTELTSCTFPDTVRTPAPAFICDQALEGYPVARLTRVHASSDSSAERMEQGRLAIQAELSEEWLSLWYGGAITPELEQLIDDWLDEVLRVVRTRNSPTGTLWLLAGMEYTEEEAHRAFEAFVAER